jgi:hypothetical protein
VAKKATMQMTERAKTWVMAVVVVALLEIIRGKNLGNGAKLSLYASSVLLSSAGGPLKPGFGLSGAVERA